MCDIGYVTNIGRITNMAYINNMAKITNMVKVCHSVFGTERYDVSSFHDEYLRAA